MPELALLSVIAIVLLALVFDFTTQRPVRGSWRVPSAARTGWGASAAHSAIAANERASAKTAAAASIRMATSG
jgi:hypothetical protein